MATREAFGAGQKWWGILPVFDPDAGNVVAEPPGIGYGFWAGAPSAVFDPGSGLFYCYHRLRWPLGDKRGGVCRVVAGPDPSAPAAAWRTVWEATREQFGANSIERASLLRDPFSHEWLLPALIACQPAGARWLNVASPRMERQELPVHRNSTRVIRPCDADWPASTSDLRMQTAEAGQSDRNSVLDFTTSGALSRAVTE